jgi:hypothetical protein
MKKILLIFAGILAPWCVSAQFIPTPTMAMKFSMGRDNRHWVAAYAHSNPGGFIYEFVPAGQTIDAWREMVAQQVTFTGQNLRQYVDGWKARLSGADPNIEMMETAENDGSIVAEYTSMAYRETAIRRFIRCSDGIYALAYHVRPQLKNENEYATWLDIIETATVIPNPQRQSGVSPTNPLQATPQTTTQTGLKPHEAEDFALFLLAHAGKDYYPPPGTSLKDLMQVLLGYTNAHPETNGKLTDNQALQVLIEKYPPPAKDAGP